MASPTQAILHVDHITKTYQNGSRTLTVLHDLSFALAEGATCAIVGPSGSGKTTLLSLCAGLDRPTAGTVHLDGHHLDTLSEDELASVRNMSVGFVFQSFQLIPTLTALENVMTPLELRGEKQARPRAAHLLQRVGLGDRQHHYPVQLSGGEQQRVALARAFIHQPRILFADEPTGNLDEETSIHITELLFSLNEEAGTTLVLVTHEQELAQRTERIIRLRGGRVVSDKALLHSSRTGEPENRGSERTEDRTGEPENRGNGEFKDAVAHSSFSDSPIPRFPDSAHSRPGTKRE
jgi:putative ABC transport system ATP-binding protein